MSRRLLSDLNGGKDGAFREWLDAFQGEPRIAWYPSSRWDYRDLLYLSPRYSERNPASRPEPRHPDIFLHTDYNAPRPTSFNGQPHPELHSDGRTTISVEVLEELPRLDPPIDHPRPGFSDGNPLLNIAMFFQLSVESNVLGDFSVPVVYVFVENATFCAEYALPREARFTHIVHIRYGYVLGGGFSSGTWLLNVLRRLRCEMLVTDPTIFTGEEFCRQIYDKHPELAGNGDDVHFDTIRVMPDKSWSNRGDVSWNLVLPAESDGRKDGSNAS